MFGLRAAALLALAASALAAPSVARVGDKGGKRGGKGDKGGDEGCISPKVVILSMFTPEANVWYNIPDFNVLEQNITVDGLSPLYPNVHCTGDGEICQLTLGEGEINAATSITAFWKCDRFDLSSSYFLTAGIAGINPQIATTASVVLARYSVQVALEYEIDYRELPNNFSTGYIPQGSKIPEEYPRTLYGTEVFELNDNLRKVAVQFARGATLNDSAQAQAYRANYAANPLFAAGAAPPSVVECDVTCSDVYFSGTLLSEAFFNYSRLITNGSATYCATAQEDNAILASLLRGAKAEKVDFARLITLRTASDFDRPYPGQNATTNLLYADPGGFQPSLRNIYLAGIRIVRGIVENWESGFEGGIRPGNYIGDIFATLGGTPDFGPYPYIPPPAKKKRDGGMSLEARGMESYRGRFGEGVVAL